MAKLAVVVLSSPEDRARIVTGLRFATMAKESGEFEDVRLIISAMAVNIFKDSSYRDILNETITALGPVVCRMNAEAAGVLKEVEESGAAVGPVGRDLIGMIKEGYEVITF